MASEIKDKFGSATALTISLGGLGNGAARQSTFVDNTSDRFSRLLLYVKIKQGTSPVNARTVTAFFLREDGHGTPHRTDGAGASDTTITILNAPIVGILNNKSSGATTGDVMYGEFCIDNPGPKWAIAIQNDTGVALDATNSNHWVRYVGVNPEAQ